MLASRPAPSAEETLLLAPPDPARERRLDRQWRAWEGRLRMDMLLATSLYTTAHLVLACYRLTHNTPAVTPVLLLGILLFLAGTGPLWKVLRTLNEPVAARHPNSARTAANCLMLVMGLAFTPCVWIFLVWA